MKVKFVEKCGLDGILYRPTDTVDLSKKVADELIESGKCVPVEAKKKAKNRSVGLDDDKLETRVETDAS